jgi:hypothetical protein
MSRELQTFLRKIRKRNTFKLHNVLHIVTDFFTQLPVVIYFFINLAEKQGLKLWLKGVHFPG